MKKGRHRRFEEARAMKRTQEVDVDAIFRIDELLDEVDEDEEPAERSSWYEEYEADAGSDDGAA